MCAYLIESTKTNTILYANLIRIKQCVVFFSRKNIAIKIQENHTIAYNVPLVNFDSVRFMKCLLEFRQHVCVSHMYSNSLGFCCCCRSWRCCLLFVYTWAPKSLSSHFYVIFVANWKSYMHVYVPMRSFFLLFPTWKMLHCEKKEYLEDVERTRKTNEDTQKKQIVRIHW